MTVTMALHPDEVKLIEIVRAIKDRAAGFGEFKGVVKQREISTIHESYSYQLSR